MGDRVTIKDLPLEERPRERLVQFGPEHLSAAELIGIILRTGVANRSAVDLGKELLAAYKDLRGIAKASLAELANQVGIGQAKAVQLKAAFELGRRVLTSNPF